MVVQMRLCGICCRPEAKNGESKELDRVIGGVLGTCQALTPAFRRGPQGAPRAPRAIFRLPDIGPLRKRALKDHRGPPGGVRRPPEDPLGTPEDPPRMFQERPRTPRGRLTHHTPQATQNKSMARPGGMREAIKLTENAIETIKSGMSNVVKYMCSCQINKCSIRS